MKNYIIILMIAGCYKNVDKKDVPVKYVLPTCGENILFCDDADLDDLPESANNNDTGDK